MSRSNLRYATVALIVVVTAAIYARCARLGFVWDDLSYVIENEGLRLGFSSDGFRFAFGSVGYAMNWHPVTWLSHMLDFQLFGLDPMGHHLVNVALHLANVGLLFALLLRWLGHEKLLEVALVSALFALHPIHVESVAWISERKDVLSMFFALAGMMSYTSFVDRGGVDRYIATLLLAALALMAKPMMVTFPALLLLLDVWPLARAIAWRRRVLEKVPFVLLSIAAVGMTLVAQEKGGAIATTDFLPLADRLSNSVVAYARYLGHLVWPRSLAPLYPHPSLPGGTPLQLWEVVGSVVLLIMMTVAACWPGGARYRTVGWLWFLGTLVPVIGWVQVGVQAMADRYAYLPFVGLYVASVLTLSELASRWGRPGRAWFGVAGGIALFALGGQTYGQIALWRDEISLFTASIERTGGSPNAHYNLGCALEAVGRDDEAVAQYRLAIAKRTWYVEAHNNLGGALAKRGDLAEAIPSFEAALKHHPQLVSAHINLGNALRLTRDIVGAVAHLTEGVRLEPSNARGLTLLAWTLATRAEIDDRAARDALEFATRAVSLGGRTGAALDALGVAKGATGDFDGAIRVTLEGARQSRSEGNVARANAMEGRVLLYRRGERFVER